MDVTPGLRKMLPSGVLSLKTGVRGEFSGARRLLGAFQGKGGLEARVLAQGEEEVRCLSEPACCCE